jgi:hypothetical protein
MLNQGEEQHRKIGRNRSNNSQDCWNTIRQFVTFLRKENGTKITAHTI